MTHTKIADKKRRVFRQGVRSLRAVSPFAPDFRSLDRRSTWQPETDLDANLSLGDQKRPDRTVRSAYAAPPGTRVADLRPSCLVELETPNVDRQIPLSATTLADYFLGMDGRAIPGPCLFFRQAKVLTKVMHSR